MLKKSEKFENVIKDLKESIIRNINQEIESLILPNLDYVELPQRIRLTNTNKYGLNWKAIGTEGSEITRLQITYEKE